MTLDRSVHSECRRLSFRAAHFLPVVISVLGLIFSSSPAFTDTQNPVGKEAHVTPITYVTENVFIVVMDGLRDEELGAVHTPLVWALKDSGAYYPNFWNLPITNTTPGHEAMLAGDWQFDPNRGRFSQWNEVRSRVPSLFEYARKELGWSQSDVWAVVGKHNLLNIDYSLHPLYGANYKASLIQTPAAASHPNPDPVTYQALLDTLNLHQPKLVMLNLRGIDEAGHFGTLEQYHFAIEQSDSIVADLWSRLQSDTEFSGRYNGTTTMIVTTDHGRHRTDFFGPDYPYYEWRGHGDLCVGCRHCFLVALGPDTPSGAIIEHNRYLIDIAPTVGALLGIEIPFAKGRVLRGMLNTAPGPAPRRQRDPAVFVDGPNVSLAWSGVISGSAEIYLQQIQAFSETPVLNISQSGVWTESPSVIRNSNGLQLSWLDYKGFDDETKTQWDPASPGIYHTDGPAIVPLDLSDASTAFGVPTLLRSSVFEHFGSGPGGGHGSDQLEISTVRLGDRIAKGGGGGTALGGPGLEPSEILQWPFLSTSLDEERLSFSLMTEQCGLLHDDDGFQNQDWGESDLCDGQFYPQEPQLAVSSDGQEIISVWSALEFNGADNYRNWEIFVSRSSDGGVTFEEPLQLTHHSAASILPVVARHDTGSAWIVFGDNRSGYFRLYMSRSTNGGQSWTLPQPVTDPGESVWAGDLAERFSDMAVLVYADYWSGNGDIKYRQILPVGVSSPQLIHTSSNISSNPVLFMIGTTKFQVAWEEFKGASAEVKTKSVSLFGGG